MSKVIKKLTKAQINKLLDRDLPDFKFDYSGEDYEAAYNDREFRDAVKDFNYVLPALKWHLKTGSNLTFDKFDISIHRVLKVKRHLNEILRGGR